MNIEQARFNMVEQQVRPWDVLDQRVLDLLMTVPREAFVPDHLRALAFIDTMLPIGDGEVMLEPKLQARMVQELDIQPGDKVLEIGTGSGYLTALLANSAARVISVELNPALSDAAAQRLAVQGIENVTLAQGNAANGWEAEQPYDVIAVTGSLPLIPPGLKESLQVGGRMFIVVGEADAPMMEVILVTRLSADEWRQTILFETVIPPLHEFIPPRQFVF